MKMKIKSIILILTIFAILPLIVYVDPKDDDLSKVSSSHSYDDVILIINNNSQISKDIGNYFKAKRNINDSRIVYINTTDREEINLKDYNNQIRVPIENFLISNNLTDYINYIVTTKEVPLKIVDKQVRSVDSELTLILGPYNDSIGVTKKIINPYYSKNETFSRDKFGIYLVTRLTGYTYSDVKNLIDRSKKTSNNGVFILDISPSKDETTYRIYNDEM